MFNVGFVGLNKLIRKIHGIYNTCLIRIQFFIQIWKIAKSLFTFNIEFFETAAEVNLKNKVSRNYLYCSFVCNQTLIVVFNTFVKIYEGI